MTEPAELQRTADLLNMVFEHVHPLTTDSLRWYYDENPVGPAAVGRVDDGVRRSGNYALVPQVFTGAGRSALTLGIGVDLAVDPEARGSGTFRKTVEDAYERARSMGHDGILGVANANSAPRMVATLGWRALDPLPVTLLQPGPGRSGFESIEFGRSSSADALFLEAIDSGFHADTDTGWAPAWTPEVLRWRISRPGFRYRLHLSDDFIAVSTATKVSGVPFAVLLKVLPRSGAVAPIASGRVATALARSHRTPFVIHWGRNPWMRVRGIRLPQSRMPSPLSLVLHSFTEQFDQNDFELGALEFLDFDAY